MSFKVGQRVKLLVDLDNTIKAGTKGEIKQTTATEAYWVRFDGTNNDTLVLGGDLESVQARA